MTSQPNVFLKMFFFPVPKVGYVSFFLLEDHVFSMSSTILQVFSQTILQGIQLTAKLLAALGGEVASARGQHGLTGQLENQFPKTKIP